MARVTGVGGVFLRSSDPKALTAWYAEHLGFQLTDWGGVNFEWSDEVPEGTGSTAWAAMKGGAGHFASGPQTAVINYRVDDLDALLAQLTAAGIVEESPRESFPYGHFAWIRDPEGNRVELWQPLAT